MAHIEKITRHQVTGLLAHDERSCENYSNEEINIEKFHLNYSLVDDNRSALERYDEQMEGVYYPNQKDINTMVQIVVLVPQETGL